MIVEYSKEFEKAARKLSGKYLDTLRRVILEVKAADSMRDLMDCKKIIGLTDVYRIRIGDLRALFICRIEGDTVYFEYLVSRGEAYSKEYREKMQNRENRH